MLVPGTYKLCAAVVGGTGADQVVIGDKDFVVQDPFVCLAESGFAGCMP